MEHKRGMTASVTVHFHCNVTISHKMKVNGDRGDHSVQRFLLGCKGGKFTSFSMTISILIIRDTHKIALVI